MLSPTLAAAVLLAAVGVSSVEDPSPSAAIGGTNRLQFHQYIDSAGYKLFIEAYRLDPSIIKLSVKKRTFKLMGVLRNTKPWRFISQDFEIPKEFKVNLGDIRANYTSGLVIVTATPETDEVPRTIKIDGIVPKPGLDIDTLFRKLSSSLSTQKRLKVINLIG